MVCPESGLRYQMSSDRNMRCLDLDEEEPLPDSMSTGKVFYDNIKKDGPR
jgi:hypothetical protein